MNSDDQDWKQVPRIYLIPVNFYKKCNCKLTRQKKSVPVWSLILNLLLTFVINFPVSADGHDISYLQLACIGNKTSMVICTHGEDWDLDKYFDENKDKLPQLCIITGGTYGTTKYDDFGNEQVIRLERYITQKRVLAKYGEMEISIPVNKDYKLKVVKGRNNFGPEEDLKSIIQKNKLPQMALFVSKPPHDIFGTPPAGKQIQLLLTEVFPEYYLQGYGVLFDEEGKIFKSDVLTMIVIPEVSIARITGFADLPKEKYQEFLKSLEEKIKTIKKFDDDDFDKSIKLVEKKIVVKTNDGDSDSDREYDYVEPPVPLPRKKSESESQTSIGRPLPEVPSNRNATDSQPKTPTKTGSQIPKQETHSSRPLPPTPSNQGGKKKHKPYENENVHHVSPIVKETKVIEEDVYEPGIYGDLDDTLQNEPEKKETLSGKVENSEHHENETFGSDNDVISCKTINDVLEVLKDLKLQKYCEMFEDDMVDGMTLKQFTEEDLKKEYNMRHAEAVRLMNFVRFGHVPK